MILNPLYTSAPARLPSEGTGTLDSDNTLGLALERDQRSTCWLSSGCIKQSSNKSHTSASWRSAEHERARGTLIISAPVANVGV